jgi:hypothetical protein
MSSQDVSLAVNFDLLRPTIRSAIIKLFSTLHDEKFGYNLEISAVNYRVTLLPNTIDTYAYVIDEGDVPIFLWDGQPRSFVENTAHWLMRALGPLNEDIERLDAALPIGPHLLIPRPSTLPEDFEEELRNLESEQQLARFITRCNKHIFKLLNWTAMRVLVFYHSGLPCPGHITSIVGTFHGPFYSLVIDHNNYVLGVEYDRGIPVIADVETTFEKLRNRLWNITYYRDDIRDALFQEWVFNVYIQPATVHGPPLLPRFSDVYGLVNRVDCSRASQRNYVFESETDELDTMSISSEESIPLISLGMTRRATSTGNLTAIHHSFENISINDCVSDSDSVCAVWNGSANQSPNYLRTFAIPNQATATNHAIADNSCTAVANPNPNNQRAKLRKLIGANRQWKATHPCLGPRPLVMNSRYRRNALRRSARIRARADTMSE